MNKMRFFFLLCAMPPLAMGLLASTAYSQGQCREYYRDTIEQDLSDFRTVYLKELKAGDEIDYDDVTDADAAAKACAEQLPGWLDSINARISEWYEKKFRIEDDTAARVNKLIEDCNAAITQYGEYHIKAIQICDAAHVQRDRLVRRVEDLKEWIEGLIADLEEEKKRLKAECASKDAAYGAACEALQEQVRGILTSAEAYTAACSKATNSTPAELDQMIPQNCQKNGAPVFQPPQKQPVRDNSFVGGSNTFTPGLTNCTIPTGNVIECRNKVTLNLLCARGRACAPEPYVPPHRVSPSPSPTPTGPSTPGPGRPGTGGNGGTTGTPGSPSTPGPGGGGNECGPGQNQCATQADCMFTGSGGETYMGAGREVPQFLCVDGCCEEQPLDRPPGLYS